MFGKVVAEFIAVLCVWVDSQRPPWPPKEREKREGADLVEGLDVRDVQV